jgi:hypothetical protein
MTDGTRRSLTVRYRQVEAIYRSIRKMRRPTTTNSVATANETTVSKSEGRSSIGCFFEHTLCRELISTLLEDTPCCSMHGSAPLVRSGTPTRPKGARAHCLEEPSGFLDPRVPNCGPEASPEGG